MGERLAVGVAMQELPVASSTFNGDGKRRGGSVSSHALRPELPFPSASAPCLSSMAMGALLPKSFGGTRDACICRPAKMTILADSDSDFGYRLTELERSAGSYSIHPALIRACKIIVSHSVRETLKCSSIPSCRMTFPELSSVQP